MLNNVSIGSKEHIEHAYLAGKRNQSTWLIQFRWIMFNSPTEPLTHVEMYTVN